MDEQELILGCIAARPKAQKALFDIYAPKLYVVCLRYMKDQMRAQDTLQDTFVKIFAHISNYKSEGAFEGWLKKIAVNTCLDQLRKDKKLLADVSVDDVSHKLDAGVEHLLEVGLGLAFRLRRQQLRVDGVENRRLDDGVVVGEKVRRLRGRLGVDGHGQLQVLSALLVLELAPKPLVLLEQFFLASCI